MNICKTIKVKKIIFLLVIFLLLILFYFLKYSSKEEIITKNEYEINSVLANYYNVKNAGKYELYRQGNPEHIYIAENHNLPFSKIETYTSSITLDKSLENVEEINDIIVSYFPENDYIVLYSENEIAIKRENDDHELITLYFTNKTGSPSYPGYGNAVFSKCENISLIIFKPNQNLYCSVVGRGISISELSEVVQSLSANVSE